MTNAPNNDDHVGNEDQLQAVHARLQELERKPRLVSSPEELESLEREIRKETEELASLLMEKHLQSSLDSEDQKKRIRTDPVLAWQIEERRLRGGPDPHNRRLSNQSPGQILPSCL